MCVREVCKLLNYGWERNIIKHEWIGVGVGVVCVSEVGVMF